MKLDEIVSWYQRKIGTYDKQPWEKTVEQKILDGFSSVTLKTAKLKPELIDVDLVRGSTFPKAKPKQSLLTVIRLAILRYLFLPIYSRWWVSQTSHNIFALLLCLYISQMINWALYTLNMHRLGQTADVQSNRTLIDNSSPTGVANKPAEEHVVSVSVLLIPMGLSLLLSLIHSQIVATNTATGAKSKHRRCSNPNQARKVNKEGRVRRRKRFVKSRRSSQDITDNSIQPRKKFHLFTDDSSKAKIQTPSSAPCNIETFETTTTIVRNPALARHDLKELPLTRATEGADCSTDYFTDFASSLMQNRKRNVNWHSPIRNYASELQGRQSPTTSYAVTTAISSSSGESATVTVNVGRSETSPDDSVRQFVEDLINSSDGSPNPSSVATNNDSNPKNISTAPNGAGRDVVNHAGRRHIGEDDGFESLNGKSSSGEEMPSGSPSTSADTSKQQLRLRLGVKVVDYRTEAESAKDTEAKSSPSHARQVPASFNPESEKSHANTLDDSYHQPNKNNLNTADASSEETEEEGDDGEIISSPASLTINANYNECTTSATEWLGITTNSEDCSYSSDLNDRPGYKNRQLSDEDDCDVDFTPTTILNVHGNTDRISCTVWDHRDVKKAHLSVLEIASIILERAEHMPDANDYIYIGVCFSVLLTLIPYFCRLCEITLDSIETEISYFDVPILLWEKASFSFFTIFQFAFGDTQWERTVLLIAFIQRLCLTAILFLIFAVAERTFKQRFLYAKLFSHLTSSRRARKSNLPHFRLNKVRNIKTWLSVRSYLKKRGPQRSVDIIVSTAFIVTLLLLAFLSVEWLKDSVHLHSHLNLEALMWASTIGIFLLRFMTLGNKIHEKYRSISVLITEQINLYLQIEQKPKKKDEFMVSNSVLKLAADLLKELETPFKISGLSANPYLFTTIKVVILSALSGVLSEMLGFKLKLHKIKIK